MRQKTWVVLGAMALCSCIPTNEDGGGSDGGGGVGAAPASTCLDILRCLGGCADTDTACPDACYNAGSVSAQNELLSLLTCMDQKQCADVPCIETQCNPELVTCLNSSPLIGGNNTGGVPTGSVPSELVGHFVSAGWSEVEDFTFGADGSAAFSRYKESGIGSCDMSVNSVWNTGSAVASGDRLTVTLAAGTTTVVWVGGCGSNYQNPADGKIFQFSYRLDLAAATPGLYLTDLNCSGDACTVFYKKN